jgi:hypothetical protein
LIRAIRPETGVTRCGLRRPRNNASVPGDGTELAHAGAVAPQQSADAVRIRVIGPAEHRHVFERASRYGRLEHERHDEVRVVDVPAELVASPENMTLSAPISSAWVDRFDLERGPDEAGEHLGLVDGAQRRVGGARCGPRRRPRPPAGTPRARTHRRSRAAPGSGRRGCARPARRSRRSDSARDRSRGRARRLRTSGLRAAVVDRRHAFRSHCLRRRTSGRLVRARLPA